MESRLCPSEHTLRIALDRVRGACGRVFVRARNRLAGDATTTRPYARHQHPSFGVTHAGGMALGVIAITLWDLRAQSRTDAPASAVRTR